MIYLRYCGCNGVIEGEVLGIWGMRGKSFILCSIHRTVTLTKIPYLRITRDQAGAWRGTPNIRRISSLMILLGLDFLSRVGTVIYEVSDF